MSFFRLMKFNDMTYRFVRVFVQSSATARRSESSWQRTWVEKRRSRPRITRNSQARPPCKSTQRHSRREQKERDCDSRQLPALCHNPEAEDCFQDIQISPVVIDIVRSTHLEMLEYYLVVDNRETLKNAMKLSIFLDSRSPFSPTPLFLLARFSFLRSFGVKQCMPCVPHITYGSWIALWQAYFHDSMRFCNFAFSASVLCAAFVAAADHTVQVGPNGTVRDVFVTIFAIAHE